MMVEVEDNLINIGKSCVFFSLDLIINLSEPVPLLLMSETTHQHHCLLFVLAAKILKNIKTGEIINNTTFL